MVKYSTDPTPAFAPTHDRMPAWKRAAAALTIGATGMFLATGCAPSERANPPASASETPGATPSETQSTPNTDPAEHLGQDTEIAQDQLNIMEQTTPVGEMLAMSDEERAQLSVADRAALGYYLAKKLIPVDQQTYNVNTTESDQISFTTDADTASGVRSGNMILSAIDEQYGTLVHATDEEASAFAAAMWYQTTDSNGIMLSSIEKQIKDNQAIATEDHIQIIHSVAKGETGWIKVGDDEDNGSTQWMKVIHAQATDDGNVVLDRTGQYVRVTVKTLEGETVFFYMRGQTGSLHDGNKLDEYAKLPLRI